MDQYEGAEKRVRRDRRAGAPHIQVSIDDFENGAAVWIASLARLAKIVTGTILVAVVAGTVWVVSVGFTDARQDRELVRNARADSAISAVFARGLSEVDRTIADVIANQRAQQVELAAQRRDIERLRDRRD